MQFSHSLSKDSVAAAAAESLSAMVQKEQTTYKSGDYLHVMPPPEDTSIVTESDRLKIVQWLCSIIDHCKFDRETVAIAMEMADRFLSKPSANISCFLRDRKQYQLLAVATLYVAIKINERVAFGSNLYAVMCGGIYSPQEIEAMELTILNGLSWRICAPTSIQMAHLILSLMLSRVDLEESSRCKILAKVKHQTEHATMDYYFVTQTRSTVAMAAIFNSIDQVERLEHQAAMYASLFAINEESDFPQDFIPARNRLLNFLEGYEAIANDDISLLEPAREEDASRNLNTDSDSLEGQSLSIAPKRVSMASVTCDDWEDDLFDDFSW